MVNINAKWLMVAALTTALLAGCGGNGNGNGSVVGTTPLATNPATSAQGAVNYVVALLANETSEFSEPTSIDSITFATDDVAEPGAV